MRPDHPFNADGPKAARRLTARYASKNGELPCAVTKSS